MNPFYRRPEFFGLWWEPYMMLFINLLYVAEVLILDFPLWLLLLIVVPMNSLYLVLRIRKGPPISPSACSTGDPYIVAQQILECINHDTG